ncbi:RidA family protein (plasmid) [Rhizobium rhizogenes]|uniref:RidA family protein n=1 Tax=Rhizobium/Agrobacterium group TaxID=227290 RepID=UPI0015740692|nr:MULTISPECIES: RidA family protein [Rhizobium/Agrobacterium group]MCF1475237.1 RidA family protein [Allorhizobium ampelinum]NTI26723.1 RidA family protein [Rhizobium rhizogenes]QTG10372.1 RidA family protein [Rhizobium rhizogenes]
MTERLIRMPTLHRVVKHNGIAYIGGIVADDESLDMEGQTRQVLTKLDAYLKEAGSERANLLSATIFITDMNVKPQMDAVWKEWFAPEELPARATIGVADLGDTTLIELIATAHY